MNIGKVLDLSYAFSTPDVAFGPLSTAFLVVFGLLCLVSNYFYFDGKYRFFRTNRATFTLVNRLSRRVAIISTIGVLFFIARLLGLQPFNARIWLDITLVIAVVWLVQGLLWYIRTYPKVRAEWNEIRATERRKQERQAERTPVPAVASVAVKPSTSSADGDGGEDEREAAIRESLVDTPRGRSARGDKRRARKR